LEEIIAKEKNTVIALGGGTICFENNLVKIKKNGLLIYIELPAIALAQRLEGSKIKRPLLKNYKGEELVSFVNAKLHERNEYYHQAHIIIPGLSLTPQILQQKISEYKK